MFDLQRCTRTNLRTMLMTWAWAFIVCQPCQAQPTFWGSVTGRDVLSESEALSSPLAELGDAVEVVAAPRPFSLEGLSQARLVAPLRSASMALALEARGSAALMRIAPSARLRWVPAEGYVMGLASGLEWMSIRGFDDMIAARLDVHAGMTGMDGCGRHRRHDRDGCRTRSGLSHGAGCSSRLTYHHRRTAVAVEPACGASHCRTGKAGRRHGRPRWIML